MTGVSRRNLLLAAGVLAGGQGCAPEVSRPAGASAATSADWRALAASIDGRLVRPGEDDYDTVRALFNTRYDGRRPTAVVEASDATDVSEAIRFARRFGLRCRARAGGHSYVGTSTVDDGLVIDVRPMRSVVYDAASGTTTLGAGAETFRAKRLLAAYGRTIPTGTCPTVGVTGLTLGGGLGVDSAELGLSCDALIEVTMVTADGRVVRAHQDRHADLLWACRGGGGGNFGVVTSMRMRTTEAQSMGVFSLAYPSRHAAVVIRGWSAHVERMPRSVWCNLQLVMDASGVVRVVISGRSAPGEEDEQAAAVERAIGVDATAVSSSQKTPMDAVRHFGGGSTTPRRSFVAGSDVVTHLTDTLSDALPELVQRRAASGTVSRVILDPLVGAIRDRPTTATAFPWREQHAELQWLVDLPEGNTSAAAVASARAWVRSAHEAVQGVSVGAYVNRLEPGRPLVDYYGPNLQRLRRIKDRVDPDRFFRSPYTL